MIDCVLKITTNTLLVKDGHPFWISDCGLRIEKENQKMRNSERGIKPSRMNTEEAKMEGTPKRPLSPGVGAVREPPPDWNDSRPLNSHLYGINILRFA
jgi:hypothetical protein